MKKIFINIGLVILVLFILDLCIGKTLRHFYFTETSGPYYSTTHAMDSTKADILIFGSSRANHHYIPHIFEDSLNMCAYNAGRDGNSIIYFSAVFKSIAKRYNPKIIIIDIFSSELCYSASGIDQTASLLPYYYSHPEIQSIVDLAGNYEKYKMLSSIYPFNSKLIRIVIGNMEKYKKIQGDQQGYVPLYGQMNDTVLRPMDSTTMAVDPIKLEALASFAEYCKMKGIRLLIITSPVLAKVKKVSNEEILKSIAEKYNAQYLDYANDSLFMKKPEYFQDYLHLNNDGAARFTNRIIQRIREEVAINNKQLVKIPDKSD